MATLQVIPGPGRSRSRRKERLPEGMRPVGDVAGRARLARHLWRMCLALFVAAGSFFFGQADEIPQALRGPHLMIPPFAALGALAFWMVRVRFPARFLLRAPAI